jgi:hypothetical protein
MTDNRDVVITEEEDVCVVCGKRIYEWEHIEHIIPYANVHKECAKTLKHRSKVIVKHRRENGDPKKKIK